MKLLCLILIVVFPSLIFAQSNYHAGFVLKHNGDTLKGYINYQEWNQNPRTIDFKVNKEDKHSLPFNAQTIRGFQINGMETYIAYTGLISTNKTNFADVPEKLDTGKKLDTVFLKQVAAGKNITLYSHNDEIKIRFFIAETNGGPVELRQYQYYNDYRQIINSDIYKGQMLLYVNKFSPGNDKLISRVNQAKYNQLGLESIVNEINNNGNDVKQRSSGRLFVGLGINSTITEVYDVNYSGLTQRYTTMSPKINLGIDFFDNPNVQRFVFRAELSLSYVAPRYYYPVTVSGAGANEVYKFNQYTAAITPQVLINLYNKDDLKIYVDGGVALNFSAYSNNVFTIENAPANVTESTTVKEPYKLESFYANFPLQVGVTLNKKFEIYLTRIGYAAYTKYDGFYASNQSYCLGVKLLLSKK
ncbi:MAG TPA: hypothetical protein VK668_16480 [Mucilaginibacter sp.]|nr:hypothetical protein [Mucilaginibacter sp.]